MSNLRGRLGRVERLTAGLPHPSPPPDADPVAACGEARLGGVIPPLAYLPGMAEQQRYEVDRACGVLYAWSAGDVTTWETREDRPCWPSVVCWGSWDRLQDVPTRFPEWAPFRDFYLEVRALTDEDLERRIAELKSLAEVSADG